MRVPGFLDGINLEGLTEKQKETVMPMLLQEHESFAKTDDEIGCSYQGVRAGHKD